MDIHCDRERREDYQNVSSDMIIERVPDSEKISEDTVQKLLAHKNAVICFMSCADIYIIERKFEDLLEWNMTKLKSPYRKSNPFAIFLKSVCCIFY